MRRHVLLPVEDVRAARAWAETMGEIYPDDGNNPTGFEVAGRWLTGRLGELGVRNRAAEFLVRLLGRTRSDGKSDGGVDFVGFRLGDGRTLGLKTTQLENRYLALNDWQIEQYGHCDYELGATAGIRADGTADVYLYGAITRAQLEVAARRRPIGKNKTLVWSVPLADLPIDVDALFAMLDKREAAA